MAEPNQDDSGRAALYLVQAAGYDDLYVVARSFNHAVRRWVDWLFEEESPQTVTPPTPPPSQDSRSAEPPREETRLYEVLHEHLGGPSPALVDALVQLLREVGSQGGGLRGAEREVVREAVTAGYITWMQTAGYDGYNLEPEDDDLIDSIVSEVLDLRPEQETP